jgi:predicted kinase
VGVIVLLNGAFGIGKTTVARALVWQLRRAVLVDPEPIGVALQRLGRLVRRRTDDFQDLGLWRRGTVAAIRAARLIYPNVVVPMAFSNIEYLEEIRRACMRFENSVMHFCLVAPVDVVNERLTRRILRPADQAWQLRRAAECCAVHSDPRFATQVNATRSVADIVKEIRAAIAVG